MQVTENIDLPAGVEPTRTIIEIQLVGAGGAPLTEAYDQAAQRTIAGSHQTTLDTLGAWSLNLTPNSNLIPAGTAWRRTADGPAIKTSSLAAVPATGGPYRWDQILTNPPGALTDSALEAHAANLTLHGGGTRLALAEVSTNFVTASTAFVDVPGATFTLTVPNRPYDIDAQVAVIIEEAAQHAEARIVAGSQQLVTARASSRFAGDLRTLKMDCPVPGWIHAPTPGTQVTYKVQVQTSVATSDATVLADLGFGLKWANYIRARAA